MAWNQPTSNYPKGTPSSKRRSKQIIYYSIVPIIIGCVVIGALILLRNHRTQTEGCKPKVRHTGKIIKEKPFNCPKPSSAAAAPAVVKVKEEKPKERPPQRVGELRDGYRLLPDGTLHRVLGIVTNTPPKMSLADKTFTHSADVELGNLLMVEPGDDLLGSAEGMYRGFGKELDEALEEPIKYDKDDTDLQRELKDGVNELRAELKARRDAGENIEKIMEDTWNQLKELSLYRQELEDQVRQLSTDDLTQKDYENLISAANQMLSDRGIKPLEMPSTLKRTLRLRQIQEQAAKKETNNDN